MNISDNAFMLIELIEKSGFEAYAVGGCVRDNIMNKICQDVDLTTSAKPYETEDILKKNGIKFIETGLKHGTVTAIVNGEPFEITTYRTDGDYNDNRHPENVEFVTDIRKDLSRRDFTINAMAYNKCKGIVDLFNGQQDIDKKLIRCVGDADTRFKEDALRIMRAVRFSSVLSFNIEEKTEKAIFDNKELLKNVSAERIFTELSKLLLGDNVFDVLMRYKEVLAVIIPELSPMFDCCQNNPWHIYDVWAHTCKAVASCPNDLKLRLTMLLHDIGKPVKKTTDEDGVDHFKGHQQVSAELSADILKRLKVSNDIYNFVITLIPIHDVKINPERKCVKRWLGRIGEDYFKALLEIKKADKLAQNAEKTKEEIKMLDLISEEIRSVIAENEAFSIKDLSVNGFDLINLGINGKEIGETLNFLLEKVISDELPNDKEILLRYLKSNCI
ncbi:MAG: CCA tRNA nucleotidyltransferase [Acetobacter sp.]|nr:CCA tRNA nucleotidyltransferase [Bacteroides sp.]MCM1340667.1 CCA tRNA nucleotidyltransferase [Acetobacter sp.]MCM1433778.1 CCA tRNA nucleotidyltransferase [Clostridiales bacterium]